MTAVVRNQMRKWPVCLSPAIVLTAVVLPVLLLTTDIQAAGSPVETGVRIQTTINTDSITVGQRLHVKYVIDYPDSLERLPLAGLNPGNCRLLNISWQDNRPEMGRRQTAEISLMTLDLESAEFPGAELRFRTPAGDTLSVLADGVSVPVRALAAAPAGPVPGENLKPLKEPWEAPADYRWIYIAAAAVLLAAVLSYLWWRRRKQRVIPPVPKPVLPPDFIALKELIRIEGLNLLPSGEFKKYYTLLSNAVRCYIEGRFRVDAMDRTTAEVLRDLERAHKLIDNLKAFLEEADLVKFAKLVPGVPAGEEAMKNARAIITRTARGTISELLPGAEDKQTVEEIPAGR